MSGSSLHGAEFGELDDASASAYQHAVLLGRFVRAEIASALGVTEQEAGRVEEALTTLRLLRPMPGRPDELVPVSPDAAAADLVGPTEAEIREMQQSVTGVKTQMLALLPAYFENRRRRNQTEAFDVVSDVGVLQAMLDECGARCRNEVLTAMPGGSRNAKRMDAARPKALDRLRRGVGIKHLYQHTVRSDLATADYVRAITGEGAEVRTTDEVIDRMVVYDREVAFLPEQHVEGRFPGAIVVREPTLVAFLCKVYDHMWAGATPFTPGGEDATDIADDLKRSIIRLMAQGHKDEMVARRLGMSVRTCRRHIARIMEEMESTSRFQTGVNVALYGLLGADFSPSGAAAGEIAGEIAGLGTS
ncbi:LuxR C-terminal-related transcriptional regulator [Streptomyces sp. NPDC047976]|uniref:helix-turn-helix transcriptional regulator n=1 Tax=Streptomyces sp. NPDC047976 TaxID=3155746 RepID=UPI0034253A12